MAEVDLDKYVGRRIGTARVFESAGLTLTFEDGSVLNFRDLGQDCCERRYMTCGDDLQSFSGAKFVGLEVLDAPDVDDGGEVHEVQFLHVRTDAGTLVCETHNEHNGYYGGFSVVVSEVT